MDTDTWDVLATCRTDADVLSCAIFRGSLYCVYTRIARAGIGCLTLDCQMLEEEEFPIDDGVGHPVCILPYHAKDLLIGIRSNGEIQHLDLDRTHYRVSVLKTSKIFSSFFIPAATFNRHAAEIYVVTVEREEKERKEAEKLTTVPVPIEQVQSGRTQISVIDADSLVQKRIVSCVTGFDFVRSLSYSHSTHSLFATLLLRKVAQVGAAHEFIVSDCQLVVITDPPRGGSEDITLVSSHWKALVRSFSQENIDCRSSEILITLDDHALPCLLMFDPHTNAFVRVLIPR